jgi:primosomal protein N' (replication factor Y)
MIAHVALPLPIYKVFSYSLPPSIAAFGKPLCRVKVPFTSRSVVGFILKTGYGESEVKLKTVSSLVDPMPLVDEACFRLCEWSSTYYVTPIGLVLKYALPSFINMEKYCAVKSRHESLAHFDNVALRKAYTMAGRDTLYDYLDKSLISLHDIFTGCDVAAIHEQPSPSAKYEPGLFMGDVDQRLSRYISLISSHLAAGHNVLVLLPDRYGSGDFFNKALSAAFPGSVHWFTSSMSEKIKVETFFRARQFTGQIFLGNKSSVFLSIKNLGLIIVERPEENEYRNEESFKFNAYQLALKKAEISGIPIVLGSASPPLEVMKAVSDGHITIEQVKHTAAPLIHYLKSEQGKFRESDLPEPLVEHVRDVVERGGNVVIHSHRRSYASGLRCGVCGRPLECAVCGSLSIAYNRDNDELTCHSCHGRFPYLEKCIFCHSPYIRFFDPGAEFLETALREVFFDHPVIGITGKTDKRANGPASKNLSGLKGGIFVGTNVISKVYGLRADRLILYRWDDFLHTGGYRAKEKMFQVFTNLIDACRPHELLVYTTGKGDFDMSSFLDPSSFYVDELQNREFIDFPPYSRYFLINVLKGNEKAGHKTLKAIEAILEGQGLDEQVLGPMEIKGHYGWRILLKGNENVLSDVLISLYRLPGVHIEADPFYF